MVNLGPSLVFSRHGEGVKVDSEVLCNRDESRRLPQTEEEDSIDDLI